MVEENIIIIMVIFMKVNLKKVYLMVMVYFIIKMEQNTKVIGLMI